MHLLYFNRVSCPQLILPYGTVITVVVDKWPTKFPMNFMNIYIQPASTDIGTASGKFTS